MGDRGPAILVQSAAAEGVNASLDQMLVTVALADRGDLGDRLGGGHWALFSADRLRSPVRALTAATRSSGDRTPARSRGPASRTRVDSVATALRGASQFNGFTHHNAQGIAAQPDICDSGPAERPVQARLVAGRWTPSRATGSSVLAAGRGRPEKIIGISFT